MPENLKRHKIRPQVSTTEMVALMAPYDIPLQSTTTLLLPQPHEVEIHAGRLTAAAIATREATAQPLWSRARTSVL